MTETMDLGIPDIDNMTKRIWRPSRPVVHLCAAWASVQQEHWKAHGSQVDFTEAMQNRAAPTKQWAVGCVEWQTEQDALAAEAASLEAA